MTPFAIFVAACVFLFTSLVGYAFLRLLFLCCNRIARGADSEGKR